ncbi:MAG: DUF3810 family protein [Acidobacteriota bacterium]
MSRTRWFQIAVVSAAMAAACIPAPAWLVDGVYVTQFFPRLQSWLTGATNHVPFAALDVLLVAAAAWATWGVVTVARAGKGKRLSTFWRWEWRCATALAGAYLIFLVNWGLNYQRRPVSASLDYQEARITADGVRAFARRALQEVIDSRAALGDGPLEAVPRLAVAARLEVAFRETARILGVPGDVSAGVPKLSILDPFYTRTGVSGMTDPLFLETFLASNLLPHELPVVLTHEWGHLAGFARESEASFFGWLVCVRGDERARYSAWLSMLLRAASSLGRDERSAFRKRLPQPVLNDLEASRRRDERDLVRFATKVSRRAYDRYLKANRVEGGIRNYEEVLQLVVGTRFDADWIPVRH